MRPSSAEYYYIRWVSWYNSFWFCGYGNVLCCLLQVIISTKSFEVCTCFTGILNNGCDEFCLLFCNAFGYGGFCKGRGGWTYGKDVGHQDKKGKDSRN